MFIVFVRIKKLGREQERKKKKKRILTRKLIIQYLEKVLKLNEVFFFCVFVKRLNQEIDCWDDTAEEVAGTKFQNELFVNAFNRFFCKCVLSSLLYYF